MNFDLSRPPPPFILQPPEASSCDRAVALFSRSILCPTFMFKRLVRTVRQSRHLWQVHYILLATSQMNTGMSINIICSVYAVPYICILLWWMSGRYLQLTTCWSWILDAVTDMGKLALNLAPLEGGPLPAVLSTYDKPGWGP